MVKKSKVHRIVCHECTVRDYRYSFTLSLTAALDGGGWSHPRPNVFTPRIDPVLTGRDSSVGIATGYGLDGPVIESRRGARFSTPVQTDPGAHPASCTMGTGSFPGVKRPGRGADHPPPSKCRCHERVELYLYSPSGLQWPVIGRTLPLPINDPVLIV